MPDEWIRQWGDPVLREVAAPVLSADEVLRAQLARMMRVLSDAEGAGLAATQVGVLRRAFVFRTSLEEEIRALVNPEVIERSAERTLFLEGCLSYQEVSVLVERPVAVRVRAQTPDGHPLTIDAEGIEASLLQHEIDHLDGLLTLDRAEPSERRRVLCALQDARRERPLGSASQRAA